VQYFILKLDCGHEYVNPAVDEYRGEPFKPDYVGTVVDVHCGSGCPGPHKVLEQKKKGE